MSGARESVRTLLLLDDDPVYRRTWERVGALYPELRVLPAASLAAARECLRAEPVDLFIADFHLGLDTSEELVRELEGRLPTVVVTGDAEIAARCLADIAVPVLTKPASLEDILGACGLRLAEPKPRVATPALGEVPAWFAPTDELDALSVVNALLAASPQALFVLDREHRIRGLNALGRARTRGAWQREVQLDDSMETYAAPGTRQGFLDAMGAALHGEHVRRERDIEYPSGASLRYRVDYTPVRANGGTGPVVGVVFGALDVTEQARARESRSLYAACLEQVAEGIVIADARGAELPIIYANPAFARITGYAIEEVIGRNCRFLQGPDRDQPGISELRAAIREGRSTQVVLRNYRKDGTLFWNQLSISPVRDDQGALTHFVGIQSDVTEKLEVEARARRLAELVDRLPAGLVRLDDELRVQEWLGGSEVLFGRSSSDALGLPLAEAVRATEPDRWCRVAQAAARDRAAVVFEVECAVGASEPHRTFDVHLGPLSDAREPGSIVAIFHDATMRKALERQVVQAQRMEAVGLVASGLAHDMRNVLGSLGMQVELVRMCQQRGKPVDPDIYTDMHDTLAAGGSLLGSLLALARPSRDRSKTFHDPARAVKDLEPFLSRLAGRDRRLVVEVPPGELPLVEARLADLQQLLMNLVINARDATEPGSTIEVRVSTCGERVVLAVADRGSGMSPEVRERALEPFFTTKQDRGTGLGLTTCVKIAEALGGTLELESELGMGTTVSVILPGHRQVHETCRVALIEADPEVREAWRAGLEKLGCHVTVVACDESVAPESLPVAVSAIVLGATRSAAEREALASWVRTQGVVTHVVWLGDDAPAELGVVSAPRRFSEDALAALVREMERAGGPGPTAP